MLVSAVLSLVSMKRESRLDDRGFLAQMVSKNYGSVFVCYTKKYNTDPSVKTQIQR